MPAGRLIDGLKTTPLVWGRCFSVVVVDFEYASDAFDAICQDSDRSALREIESMFSSRTRERDVLLSGSTRNRPVGPFSSTLLEAFSIRSRRDCMPEELLGGWFCHSREEDALSAAKTRFGRFCSASSAVEALSARFQVYSARVAGRFAAWEDIQNLLAGSRSANDPQVICDTMAALRGADLDGIVLDRGDRSTAALVLCACAMSQLRQVRRFEMRWEDGRVVQALDSTDAQCGLPEPELADPSTTQ